jgi:hypothetical protein
MLRRAKQLARRVRLGGASEVVPSAPAAVATEIIAKPNPFISNELPPDVTQLSARYRERRITHFLLGAKNIERQNKAISQSVRAFFDSTKSLSGISMDDLAAQISEFRDVYLNAPITMNKFGLHFSTGLLLFLIARRRDPTLIVESGVYKGLSTYILSAACPTAELHAFDPNLSELSFRSGSATYHATDWMDYDVRSDPLQSSLIFFDDHQCQARRVIEAHDRGYRQLIFDDSWPIEAVTGCGWPPIPSIDMVVRDSLEPNEMVQWIEDGNIWTYVHDEEMQRLCAKARALIAATYDVPTLYRESGIGPTSAMKYVELVP